ncbi:MAG TPA: methionine--tRNA ligase [Thermomicrobiales bacterium]|nr:methionine--tRNA ligase [Thermomicrobiales bacterium]
MTTNHTTQSPYFLSTSIPYVNARPHVGHALEFVLADVYSRYRRQQGRDVFFLSGSDENSLKNVQAAEALGIPTRELVERYVRAFQELCDMLHVSNDDFIRTSVDQRHVDGAKRIWQAMVDAGDVYYKSYSGLYCVGCEQFYMEDELVEGRCPEHGTVPELVQEENAFFRLSKYGDALHEAISADTLQVVPRERKNEVLRFIESGLEDFSISRSRARARDWGIEVPDDPGQVMYVWVDALANYITALDYATDGERFQRYWGESPERVHVIGKGILRFHAIYWPAMLLSAGLPLPTHVVVHGYLTIGGQKISKSLGNVIDPADVVERFGTDPLRYYLLRDFSPFGDGDFTIEKLAVRYRADLGNDLGNLLNRAVSMIGRYRDGAIPAAGPGTELEDELTRALQQVDARVEAAMQVYDPQAALVAIWELVTRANGYVENTAPWTLAKAERGGESPQRLDTVLSTLATTLGRIAWLLQPFLPETSARIAAQLGSSGVGYAPHPGQQVAQPEPIFPRIEDEAAAASAVSD